MVLYPVSPSFLARYPHLLLKAEGVCSESPPLPWYVEVSQNGQPGSLAMVHPSCRGRGSLFPLLCLRKDPEPPPIPSHLVLMCPPTRDSPAPLAQYTSVSSMQQEVSAQVPQPWAGMLRSGLPLGGGFAAQPFPCGRGGSSPSFSHCELSVGV